VTLLPYTAPEHQRAHQFLVEEAHVLDSGRWDDWLTLLTDDVTYVMPARVTVPVTAEEPVTIDHFAEDRYSLRKRVERMATAYAWTEDPASRVRHHVTNVRTFATDDPERFVVESALLLFRSRGDRPHDLVSAGRTDTLVATAAGLRLARRVVQVDEAVLRTQNLAIFL
jgi:3-phenylpropionate/cinnamic acid dioxygenase small subunit